MLSPEDRQFILEAAALGSAEAIRAVNLEAAKLAESIKPAKPTTKPTKRKRK